MKFLILLLSLFSLSAFAQGDLSATIKGQAQTAKNVVGLIEAPNNQVTKTGGINALIETGNNNLLANPSFEHATYSTGWTSLSGTSALETSVVIHGKKSLKITYSSHFVSLTPTDTTLYAAQFADETTQGLASIRVKAPFPVKICARKAGVTTTICGKASQGSSKWELIENAFVFGGTSNGFEIKSDVTVTGVAYFDNAKLEPAKLLAETSVVGPWTDFTPTGTWTTNTTYTGKYRQVGQNLEVQYRLALAGAPNAVVLSLNLPSGFSIDSNNRLSTSQYDSGLGSGSAYDNALQLYPLTVVQGATNTALDVQVLATNSGTNSVKVNSGSGITQTSPFTWGASDTLYVSISVPVTQLAASTNVFTGNTLASDRIGEPLFLPVANAPSGFISADNKSIGLTGATYNGTAYKALYDVLWALPGTVTTAGHVFRISSAKGASADADWAANKTITIDFTTSGASLRAKRASDILGAYQEDALQGHGHTDKYNSNSLPNIGVGYNGSTGNMAGNSVISGGLIDTGHGTPRTANETRVDAVFMNAFIRYAPKQEIVVANLSGLEKCANSFECEDRFTAYVTSAGVVSAENLDWISGNVSVGGASAYTYTLNINTTNLALTSGMVCTYTADNVGRGVRYISVSPSVITQTLFDTNTKVAVNDTGFSISCTKTGADYIGKTAKAVASDQNVRAIGSIGVDIQSVYFGSGANCINDCTTGTCTICRQRGNKITSVTHSGTNGLYNINGIDGTKYECSGSSFSNVSANWGVLLSNINTSTSSFARVDSGSGGALRNSAYNNAVCIGIP